MFASRIIDSQIDTNLDTSLPETPRPERYIADKEILEQAFRERLSKLPKWRRKLINTALDGGW